MSDVAVFFFFFKPMTAYEVRISDWSSDVCSSNLSDVEAPVLSIVVPALNEEAVVGTFVDWCHEGLAKAGVPGEVLIVDSSTDRTPEIVLARGGRVLKVPKRGLGRAYIDAVPFIRGQWVLMGDADCNRSEEHTSEL